MGDKTQIQLNRNRCRTRRFYEEKLFQERTEVGSVPTKQKKARAAAKRAKKARRKNR